MTELVDNPETLERSKDRRFKVRKKDLFNAGR